MDILLYLSVGEIRILRMTRLLFWSVGYLGGFVGISVGSTNPIVAIAVTVLLYIVGVFIWERLVNRILTRKIPMVIERT